MFDVRVGMTVLLSSICDLYVVNYTLNVQLFKLFFFLNHTLNISYIFAVFTLFVIIYILNYIRPHPSKQILFKIFSYM